MKSVKQNPAHVFLALITIAFVALVGLQIIIIANQDATSQSVETQAPQVALTENELKPALVEEASGLPTSTIAPTTTSAPSADIRLGVLERSFHCPVITQITAKILEQELQVKSQIIEYASVDQLFDALAKNDVDISLCFIDPLDRTQIKPRLGYIRQIGSYYWQEQENKLQIWAHTETKSNLRKEMPCVLNFFENFSLTDGDWQQQEPNQWILSHSEQIQAWTLCPK